MRSLRSLSSKGKGDVRGQGARGAAGRAAVHARRALASASTNETSTSTAPPSPSPKTTSHKSNVVPFRPKASRKRVLAPPDAPTVCVILPGFGNAAEDYLSAPTKDYLSAPTTTAKTEGAPNGNDLVSSIASFFSSNDEDEGQLLNESVLSSYFDSDDDSLPSEADERKPSLASSLESRGFRVSVVPVRRSHWLRVARCAFDPAYWRGEADVETSYGWYLELAGRAVEEAAALSPSSRVVLVGHSAGGWLGRALLGTSPAARRATTALVTLGTPHAPNPRRCVTGGALRKVNERWPGAFFDGEGRDGGVRYVAVAGNAVVGEAGAPRGSARRSAAAAYSQVAGGDGGGVAGDGVVPLSAATLYGANNVVLDGVFHAPGRTSGGEGGEARPSSGVPPWFGDESVVDSWLEAMVKALE